MILTESQWNDIKRISWNKVESKRIREQVHDDKLIVGWCGRQKRWMLARIVDVTVEIRFGVKTIPTKERVPFVWKVWEDDDGVPLGIRDPRLVHYIRRCDLWRMGADKYIKQFDDIEYIDDMKEKSELDNMHYIAKHAVWDSAKKLGNQLCGTDLRPRKDDRFFFMH